jgi:hypothetical protein
MSFVWMALALSCSSEGCGGNGNPLKEEFDAKFASWKGHCNRPEISIHSNLNYYIKTPEYDALVAMGKPALPFLMEKLEAGEFILNDAVKKITGINIVVRESVPLKWGPDVPPFSALDVSKLWLEWWKEHKDLPEWKTDSEK